MRNVGHALHDELVSIVSADNVFDDPDRLSGYVQDKSPFPESEPGIVVRPGTVEEVSAILALANQTGNPVMARGGGFSLTGYAQTAPGRDIILDSRRLNRVLDIDEVNMTITAQCGIIMKDLHTQAADRGFYVHTVGIPIAYTTLGGVLSGVQGGGYPVTMSVSGTDLNYLLGLKVVLPSGTVVDTSAGGANIHRETDFIRGGNAPDLTGMFVGDGGSFGVKTQATLQLFPRPSCLDAGCWDFDDFDNLWQAILALTSQDTLPYENVTVLQSKPLSLFYLSRGDDDSVAKRLGQVVDRICESCGGKLAPKDMQQYAVEIGVGDPDYQDIFINVHRGLLAFMSGKKEFPEIYAEVRAFLQHEIDTRDLEEIGISLMVYFGPVMRNAIYTTISIIYDEEIPEGREIVLELQKEGYRRVIALGGCPEPHQGFASQANAAAWSPEYSGLMSSLKKTLDPNNILNPGLWGL